MGSHCHPVRHTRPALPMRIPAPVPAAVNNKDETEGVGYDSIYMSGYSSESDDSGSDFSDSD